MMRVFLDTDVVLDYILGREPWTSEAMPLWEAIRAQRIKALECAITPLNAAYVARRTMTSQELRDALRDLLNVARVVAVDEAILRAALTSPIADYEDAVQNECAVTVGADAIITRNVSDFQNATLPVYTPADFVAQFLAVEKSKSIEMNLRTRRCTL